MSMIELGGGHFHRFDADTLRGMFAFRREVFSDRLGWEVGTHEDLEFDMFDTMNPVYMLARGTQGTIEGCWRLMPTTDDYMLKDTFPQLLRGEAVPSDMHVWELSRFAVDAGEHAGPVQAPLNTVTLDMIRRLYEFARTCGVKRFVTVTSVALERLLKRTGLPITRLGDGKAQRVGRVLSVACWVEVNEQFENVVYPPTRSSISRAA